jgi:hypothetical protein
MFFIVGRDRADFLDTIIDNFKEQKYVNSISGMVLERGGMEALKTKGIDGRSISEINPSEYSASFVRNLVKNDKKADFVKIYNQYITPEEIEKLYKTIEIGIKMKTPSSKNIDENPQSIYFDGKLLPVMCPDENNHELSSIKGGVRTKKISKPRRTKKIRK